MGRRWMCPEPSWQWGSSVSGERNDSVTATYWGWTTMGDILLSLFLFEFHSMLSKVQSDNISPLGQVMAKKAPSPIAWSSVDLDLWHHTVSLSHNALTFLVLIMHRHVKQLSYHCLFLVMLLESTYMVLQTTVSQYLIYSWTSDWVTRRWSQILLKRVIAT